MTDYAYVADGSGERGTEGLQVIDLFTPNWHYFPSHMADSAQDAAQDVVIGFSGSSCGAYVGAHYCSWRHGSATPMVGPVLLKAGEDHFPETSWGDYSCTSLDPADPDGLTFWTVQECAGPSPNTAYLGW